MDNALDPAGPLTDPSDALHSTLMSFVELERFPSRSAAIVALAGWLCDDLAERAARAEITGSLTLDDDETAALESRLPGTDPLRTLAALLEVHGRGLPPMPVADDEVGEDESSVRRSRSRTPGRAAEDRVCSGGSLQQARGECHGRPVAHLSDVDGRSQRRQGDAVKIVRLDNETAENLAAWRQERADRAWRSFQAANPNTLTSPAGWKAEWLEHRYRPSWAVRKLAEAAFDRDLSHLAFRFEHTPAGTRGGKQVVMDDEDHAYVIQLMKCVGLEPQKMGRFIRALVDQATGAPLPDAHAAQADPWGLLPENAPNQPPPPCGPLTSSPSSPGDCGWLGETSSQAQLARPAGSACAPKGTPGKKPCMRAFLGARFFSQRGSDRDENVVFAALLGHANNNGLFVFVSFGKLAEYLPEKSGTDRVARARLAVARLVEAEWLKPAQGHNSIYGQVNGWYPQVPPAPSAATPEAA